MLQDLVTESEGLVDNLKTKVMMENYTPIYVNTIQIEKIDSYTAWDINTASDTKPRQGYSKNTHCQLDTIRQASQHQG